MPSQRIPAARWIGGGLQAFDQIDSAPGGQARLPIVTVAVPSYNQGRFLDETLRSIFAQPVPIEVMLADGGSTDETQRVIARWRHRLTWCRSAPDRGQSASINEAIARGRAPFVCWMNSDDLFLPGGLSRLIHALHANAGAAVAYGGCHLIDADGRLLGLRRAKEISARSLSRHPVISQPASLIRRAAWDRVDGVKENLHLSLDYDLWWRLYRSGAKFTCIPLDVAAARFHPHAKSFVRPREMYAEAKSVVRNHYGSLPMRWRLKEPFSIHARKQGTMFERVMRAYRFWSMQLMQEGKAAYQEHAVYPHEPETLPSQSLLESLRVEVGR